MRKWNQIQQKRKRMILGAAVSLLLVLLQWEKIYAQEETDPDYSMEITAEMQMERQNAENENGEETLTENQIEISDGIIYDQDRELYGYPVGEQYVYANVLAGMLTQSAVSISVDDGVTCTVYRENEALDLTDIGEITDAGTYTVMTGREGEEQKLFSFQIIGEYTNQPMSYALPKGCITVSMTCNEEDMLSDNRNLSFSKEGLYVVEWRCVKNGMDYSLNFHMDRTPPELTFDGLKDGKAHKAVTIQGLEDGDILSIIKDGKEYAAKTTLTQPGDYEICVSDAAGNTNVYSFYILFYLNAAGISVGMIILLSFLVLGIYLYVSRKKLRVR